MSLNTRERTSFEWFFGPPASNFPQATTSSALQDLSIVFTRLLELYMVGMSSAPLSARSQWAETVREATSVASKFDSEFEKVDAFNLIKVLLKIRSDLETLREHSETQFNNIWPQYRRVLASLVLYAKESRDARFKQSVLDLINRAEIVS